MVQDSIEAILQRTLGLDTNSVGTRIIDRAVQRRQNACGVSDRTAYLSILRSSPQELNQLIEAVVIPETWFFRDQGSFELLRQYAQQQKTGKEPPSPQKPMRVLSVPCSTGEEPYSIAISLMEAGLTMHQFRVDAVDVSQSALAKAKRGVYSKKSFRGNPIPHLEHYFQQTAQEFEVRSPLQNTVQLIHGNILEPTFLIGKQYHVIFCRNLLIYLDEAARRQTIDALDRALMPLGLLFLGAVETPQLAHWHYQSMDLSPASETHHLPTFAFQKQPTTSDLFEVTARGRPTPPVCTAPGKSYSLAKTPDQPDDPTPAILAHPSPTSLETARQFADRGQLTTAAELCESYLRSHPDQAVAYVLLGEIYQGLNQPRQAAQLFQKALYLNPDAYDALIHLALLKQQQGNQIESERLRKRAQRLADSAYQQSRSGG